MLLLLIAAAAPPSATPAASTRASVVAPPAEPSSADPYSFALSAIAQRYYRQCRAEQRLRDAIARDFDERQLPEPPIASFRDRLSPSERRDAELVCLGAAQQRLDDLEDMARAAETPPPAAPPRSAPAPSPAPAEKPPAPAAPAPARSVRPPVPNGRAGGPGA